MLHFSTGMADKLVELPFRVFHWVAGADDDICPKEVDVFLRMLEHPSWCQSEAARRSFPEARGRYSAMWKAAQGGELRRSTDDLKAALAQVATALGADERRALHGDLTRLGQSVARASGGFFGLGAASRDELAALALLEELYDGALGSEAPASAATPSARSTLPAEQESSRIWTKGRARVRCTRIIDETRDVKTFQLVGEPACQFSYRPGQALVLEVPIDGKPVYRSYTIASTPSRPHLLEVTIKRVPGGVVSNWLHDNLRVGDLLHISGPSGKFSCTFQSPDRVLLLSGGSGITPVMSMLRWLYDTGSDADVVFLHSARTQGDLIFEDELELLERRHPSLQVIYTLTRPDPQWRGAQGRISSQLLRDWIPDFEQRTVYLCGPSGFMEASRRALEQAGFDMSNFYSESFGGVPTPPKIRRKRSLIGMAFPTPTAPERKVIAASDVAAPVAASEKRERTGAVITFTQSDKEIAADPARTILELAEDAGISIPNACRVGVCGTCKVQVEGASVEMTCSDGLEPHEAEMGFALACVGRCAGAADIDA